MSIREEVLENVTADEALGVAFGELAARTIIHDVPGGYVAGGRDLDEPDWVILFVRNPTKWEMDIVEDFASCIDLRAQGPKGLVDWGD